MTANTINGLIAIEPVKSTQVEAKVSRGMATVAQRTDTVVVSLVMSVQVEGSTYDTDKTKVILKGDAGFQQWNKQVMDYNGKKFVLCPVNQIVGFEINDD